MTTETIGEMDRRGRRFGWRFRFLTRSARTQTSSRLEFTVGEALAAVCFAVLAVACWAWLPGGHPLQPALAGIAALAYMASLWVELPLAKGFAAITQPIFVWLVFVLPLDVVPLTVGALTVASLCLRCRSFAVDRLAVWLSNSWYCVPPTLVLLAAAPERASWSHWPVYVAAFGAQFACDLAITLVRFPLPRDRGKAERISDILAPTMLDALLTPAGLTAAVLSGSEAAPGAAVVLLIGVVGVMLFLARERLDRIDHQERARRDPLTGLANRARFEEQLENTAARVARSDASAALLLIDVNDFKAVNDTHGHTAGDYVLRAFATRVLAQVRDGDLAARIGGDEFAVLLTEPTTIETAQRIASAIHRALEEPIDVPQTGRLSVSGSIGAALLTRDVLPADALTAADMAMYAQKRRNKRRSPASHQMHASDRPPTAM